MTENNTGSGDGKLETGPDSVIDLSTSQQLDEPKANPEGLTAWLQVFGGFCLNLNTWGLMNAYGSVQAFLMFVFSFVIGPVFDAEHLRALLLVGSFLSVFGFFMTSLCSEYWQVFLAQGVTMGIGFGCLYLPAPALISMHFEKNLGLAMGIASCGSGIGGVIFPLAFSRLQPCIGFGWATRVLAFILLATSIVPILVMRLPMPPPNTPGEQTQSSPKQSLSARVRSLPSKLIDKSAFSDSPYFALNFGLLTGYMGIYIILYYVNLLAIARTDTSQSLSFYIIVIINAATILGRIVPSAIADRIGAAHVLGLTSLMSCILTFCVLAVHTSADIIVWSVIFGVPAGAFQGLPAAGVVSVSDKGNARIGVRLGMTLFMVGIGVLIAEPIAGAILGGVGSWPGLVGWCAALLAASAMFMFLARFLRVGMKIRAAV